MPLLISNVTGTKYSKEKGAKQKADGFAFVMIFKIDVNPYGKTRGECER